MSIDTVYQEILNYDFQDIDIRPTEREKDELEETRQHYESTLDEIKRHIRKHSFNEDSIRGYITQAKNHLKFHKQSLQPASTRFVKNWIQKLNTWKNSIDASIHSKYPDEHARLWEALHALTRIMGKMEPRVLVEKTVKPPESMDECSDEDNTRDEPESSHSEDDDTGPSKNGSDSEDDDTRPYEGKRDSKDDTPIPSESDDE